MKATMASLAILSTLVLGACSSTPAEKPAAPSTAASQAPVAATTPSETAKPVEANPAALKAPADPAVLAQIDALKQCSMVKLYRDVWTAVSVKPEVPTEHQELAKDYVVRINKKGAELGCQA